MANKRVAFEAARTPLSASLPIRDVRVVPGAFTMREDPHPAYTRHELVLL